MDSLESAARAGLQYVSDRSPGFSRKRHRNGFRYCLPDGKPLRHPAHLERIRLLVIPPAWESVWICCLENGHIQASGIDARNRKQYRYHSAWRQCRDETKYNQMLDFARALPKLRRRLKRDLALDGLPRDKILAAVVSLLESTLIRVGNDEYARQNHSFGLTTLQNRHALVVGTQIRFQFRGKSGIEHDIDLCDPVLAKIVRQCQHLPGQELFEYLDEFGQVHDVRSQDVNDYIREITGGDYTAKDFRTWAGTTLAARMLEQTPHFDSETAAKRNVAQAIRQVARRLGNTPAVCRKCYVHPAVISSYLDGSLKTRLAIRPAQSRSSALQLPPEEAAVWKLLNQILDRSKSSSG
ncbi:MAG: Eukaryotic topoisomerase catalytic core [Planctomycetaceae bacterium]|nr:Eukaryotic topoisomerase catalytic core [Planctomycetaceae bacterium]